MKTLLAVVLGWYLMLQGQYLGPFPTLAACEAFRQSSFGFTGVCVGR